jgi:hypothetical protein
VSVPRRRVEDDVMARVSPKGRDQNRIAALLGEALHVSPAQVVRDIHDLLRRLAAEQLVREAEPVDG